MNNAYKTRHELGLTQKEMAHILKISRSHYSMHESGKRRLPIEAIAKLSDMAAQSEGEKSKIKSKKSLNPIDIRLQYEAIVRHLLKENDYQQQATNRRIDAVIRKQDVAEKRATARKLLLIGPSQKKKRKAPIAGQYELNRLEALTKNSSGWKSSSRFWRQSTKY